MTLLDIRNQIITILTEKEEFSAEDFAQIRVKRELTEKRDFLISAALKQLCEIGIISEISEGFWVLDRPMNLDGQEIHISMITASRVADAINTFISARNLDIPPADALHIHEGNIIMILSILDSVIEE